MCNNGHAHCPGLSPDPAVSRAGSWGDTVKGAAVCWPLKGQSHLYTNSEILKWCKCKYEYDIFQSGIQCTYWSSLNFLSDKHWHWFLDVTSATLKACLGVLPVIVILGLREYSQNCYTMFAGVLPQKWSEKALGVLPYLQTCFSDHSCGSTPTKMV